jgi:hypothetical protein
MTAYLIHSTSMKKKNIECTQEARFFFPQANFKVKFPY